MVGTESLSLNIPVSMYLHTYKRNEWTNFMVKHTGFNLTWSTEKVRKISRVYLIWYIVYTYYSARVLRSVQFSRLVVSDSLWPHELQHTRPPCPSTTPGVHSNSCPSSQWCHPTISSSVVPFSSCPQFHPASESLPMNQLFAWGGQSTGVSALASVPPKKSQGWSPSEWTGWISLQSKGIQEFSPTPQFKSINSSALSLLHSPTLTSIHNHRKNNILD